MELALPQVRQAFFIMALLESLKIRNFRNLKNTQLKFNPGYNLFVGENGQGKTNLLESIYFISLLRSFRTSNTNNLKNFANRSEPFFIGADIVKNGLQKNISVGFDKLKVTKINHQKVTKMSKFINEIICIIFSPEDIDLVTGPANNRRRFLDIALSQLNRDYLVALQNYKKTLKHRNAILKQLKSNPSANRSVLKAYDGVLIDNATLIYKSRHNLITDLKNELHEKSKTFYDGKFFDLHYSSQIKTEDIVENRVKERFTELLQSDQQKEIERGVTASGPHLDDFHFILNEKKLKHFGSQGQCRLSSLLLRLSISEIYLQKFNDQEVIFLVDDVTGELDVNVKENFFSLLEKGKQVFFACTEIPEHLKNRENCQVFSINNGEVTL